MKFDASFRVLLVDDMPAMRSILRGMLEEVGISQVIEVEDGDLAWETLQATASGRAQPFSMIIADWNMPGMSGVDLLRAVRNQPTLRGLPFFMVTARGDGDHVEEASRAGVTDYLVKPFTGPELAQKISSAFQDRS
jgi:two-component system chemotaxis response regulator CheY